VTLKLCCFLEMIVVDNDNDYDDDYVDDFNDDDLSMSMSSYI